MSWIYDKPELPDCYDHEGGIVALTYLTEDRAPGLFREIRYPDKATYGSDAIARIQAGCACGWRSPHFVPARGTYRGESGSAHQLPQWTPYTPWVTDADEERCRELWREHVHHAVPALAAALARESES